MKKLCVLGVTGSIGQNVCKVSKNNFEIVSVALNNRIDLLENIILLLNILLYKIMKKQICLKKIIQIILFLLVEIV